MTRQTNPDGLREAILEISRDLLNEGGPSSLSMREVARRAGCTHQAPYHYFQGREAILVTLVEEGYRDLERALREVRETSEGRAPQDVTRAAGHAYLACALANPGVFRIMFRSDMYDAGAHSGLRAASQAARTQLTLAGRARIRDRRPARGGHPVGLRARPRHPRPRWASGARRRARGAALCPRRDRGTVLHRRGVSQSRSRAAAGAVLGPKADSGARRGIYN